MNHPMVIGPSAEPAQPFLSPRRGRMKNSGIFNAAPAKSRSLLRLSRRPQSFETVRRRAYCLTYCASFCNSGAADNLPADCSAAAFTESFTISVTFLPWLNTLPM